MSHSRGASENNIRPMECLSLTGASANIRAKEYQLLMGASVKHQAHGPSVAHGSLIKHQVHGVSVAQGASVNIRLMECMMLMGSHSRTSGGKNSKDVTSSTIAPNPKYKAILSIVTISNSTLSS